MPERNRGGRKSQTSGKFSLVWVKCRGGSGGTSRGRGKPFPGEQPKRSGLYEASGDLQRFNSDAEGQNPGDGQELVPQRMISQQLSLWKRSSPSGMWDQQLPPPTAALAKKKSILGTADVTSPLLWSGWPSWDTLIHLAVPDGEVTPSSHSQRSVKQQPLG